MGKVLGVVLVFGIGAFWLFGEGLSWSALRSRIRREFPNVRQISTVDLADELGKKQRGIVLLDVRTPAEFAVSHLQGAQRVDPDADAGRVTASKDAEIVTYCSVGYRSSAFAERLRKAGFSESAISKARFFSGRMKAARS